MLSSSSEFKQSLTSPPVSGPGFAAVVAAGVLVGRGSTGEVFVAVVASDVFAVRWSAGGVFVAVVGSDVFAGRWSAGAGFADAAVAAGSGSLTLRPSVFASPRQFILESS
jgi:hypothetical protein